MSHLLWKSYWDNDVDKFRRLLAPAGFGAHTPGKPSAVSYSHIGGNNNSGPATPPRPGAKGRKASSQASGARNGLSNAGGSLGKAEVNSRDHAGLTLLLRSASSTSPNALGFVEALLDHPAVDLYARDTESGWNALHRALYSGNIAIARLLLQAEQRFLTETAGGAARVGQLIKTKDKEGNSPFDLYNCTIAARGASEALPADDSDTESTVSRDGGNVDYYEPNHDPESTHGLPGDELYTFGSNKNLSLGVGDEDDRQFPERLQLNRPEQLVQSFYEDYLAHKHPSQAGRHKDNIDTNDVPALIRGRPLHIRDVVMSKFHSAVLTGDPVSNLYICGLGRGGRLGLGDENTRFRFVPVQGPLAGKRISQVALGQNHTLAIVTGGELWSWGSNAVSQLGYALPTPARPDEEPVSLTPRQVFGPLKKEIIIGSAASAVHSVAHTSSSLYCWGRNLGQLGLMDADSRSLEVQSAPRKVAASLISTPILAVSAIEKATTCLLASNAVFVFTSYGYNIVKFPAPDIFANTRLGNGTVSVRSGSGNMNKIKAVTSGGDTIAALSARGDLFLMNLNHHVDTNTSATSTTNPAKIKRGAVSQAQCVWSARKDGVTSASVGEHGSVIICTESGAVWRRVKRAKAKDASAPGSAAGIKRKDFKFQRVPGITNAVTVRGSTFGAFAAVRRDCTTVVERIHVGEQTLWDDLASLFPLRDFEGRGPSGKHAKAEGEFWDSELAKRKIGPLAHEVLRSADVEADLEAYLRMVSADQSGFDIVVCTSSAPELRIPIHGWVLGARSTTLRKAFSDFRDEGRVEGSEVLEIEEGPDGKALLTFLGIDIISLVNLILYAYRDEVVPVWNYLRQVSHMAFRYRQVRVELMKLATRLNMAKLEAAARTQSRIVRSLDQDFRAAARDMSFLDSGDVILDLDGAEVPVHSYLLRQRCPFFYGLFEGRSGGRWLASRRENRSDDEERIRIDLSHVEPGAFKYVLLHLYGDAGLELFDDTVSDDIDEFSEMVMEVMSIANELMLDRLSQICQQIISRFVTTRNVSGLLNEISPCAVEEFKDAGLEYTCLHMEAMLENHLLDDLDDDLMLELDEVVRENQLARAPFSRSGRAEALLHEQHPELVEDIEEERRRRTKEIAWKATHKEEEKKLALSYRAKFGSFDDGPSVSSPATERSQRKAKAAAVEQGSPSLRPKASQGDLIFSMDEDETQPPGLESPRVRQGERRASTQPNQPQTPSSSVKDKERASFKSRSQAQRWQPVDLTGSPQEPMSTPQKETPRAEAKTGSPWAASSMSTPKLDLRAMLSETAGPGPSGITAGLEAQKKGKEAAYKAAPTKLSQKERKKQQQLEASQRLAVELMAQEQPKKAWDTQASESKAAPWKVVESPGPRTSLKDVFSASPTTKSPIPQRPAAGARAVPSPGPVKPLVAAETTTASVPRRTASPDTRFSGQSRSGSGASGSAGASSSRSAQNPPPAPYSKSYMKPAPKIEQSLGLSLEDIIGQQRREQELVKEAVAKRPLEEIQQEQAFQEWWDQESKRAQEEEAKRLARENQREKDGGGKRRGRGRGGRGRGKGGVGGGGERSERSAAGGNGGNRSEVGKSNRQA